MATVEAAVPAPAAQAPSPDSGSSPSSTTTAPAKNPPPDPAKVREILAHKESRNGKGASSATDATNPPTASSSAAKDGKSGPADAPSTDSSSSTTSEPAADPDLALRLARIAKKEDAARAVITEAAGLKTELGEFRTWKETRAKDPVAAATTGLTKEQREAVFWALNDEILKDDPARPPDPAELAKRTVKEELDARAKADRDAAEQRQVEARTAAADAYIGGVHSAFSADPKKWPAIVARGVSVGDIHSFAESHWKEHGTAPDAAQVLDHFQKLYETEIEAAGYTRQKVEAQPGGEGTANGQRTITNEWSAGAGAASGKGDHEKSRRESSEDIKRRHFKR